MRTLGRSSFIARLSRYFSDWTIALPVAIGVVTATALAVIYIGAGGSQASWFLHPAALKPLLLVAALVAACCVPLGAREGRARPPRRLWRLFRLPVLAACIAIILVALGSASRPPHLILGMALVIGLLVGVARALTITLQFDRVWNLISLPRTPDGLCVATLLTVAAGMSIGSALVGSGGAPYGLAAMTISVLCGSFLAGRIATISLRFWLSPHVDLFFT